jgi:hypothetical protein
MNASTVVLFIDLSKAGGGIGKGKWGEWGKQKKHSPQAQLQ